jgi:hypothetical protein
VGHEGGKRLQCTVSRTIAIEVYLKFEHALFEKKILFPFPLETAKLCGDYFGIKGIDQ